jgi:hypothetical protein
MKIRSVRAELFHAEGHTDKWTHIQTDMMKPIVSFRNSVKAPKNCSHLINNLYICDRQDFASALRTEYNHPVTNSSDRNTITLGLLVTKL